MLRLVGGAGLAILSDHVRSGDVVVDIGAHHGAFTKRLSELVGPGGTVVAFEPNPSCLSQLRSVAAESGNVIVHALALSDRSGTAALHVPAGDEAYGRLRAFTDGGAAKIDVKTARLDDMVTSASFVKCDVEGHELAVLRGAEELLKRARPVVLVEVEWRHAGDAFDDTFAYLAELGYVGSALAWDGPMPLDDFDLERDQLAHLGGGQLGQMPRGYVNDFLFRPRSD